MPVYEPATELSNILISNPGERFRSTCSLDFKPIFMRTLFVIFQNWAHSCAFSLFTTYATKALSFFIILQKLEALNFLRSTKRKSMSQKSIYQHFWVQMIRVEDKKIRFANESFGIMENLDPLYGRRGRDWGLRNSWG